MLSVNVKIIQQLKNFVHQVAADPSLLAHFRSSDKDFCRTRKLPFYSLVILITRLCKRTLSVELDQFFEDTGAGGSCSVSALSQQRSKLNGNFFYCWNHLLCHCFYSLYAKAIKRWKGYRVIAADGSTIPFINTPELREHFGVQSNGSSSFVMGHTYFTYDVLNKLVLHAQLESCRISEVSMAYEHIDDLQPDMLMLYDRGYYGYKMVALHLWQEKEIKFIIRAREDRREVADFIASGKSSAIVKIRPQRKTIRQMYRRGYKITYRTALTVRLVRIQLKNSVEVVVTNLWKEEGHRNEQIEKLYSMRWGIETNINLQKNLLQMESFSGLKLQSVLQDFHATIFLANLHAVLSKAPQQLLDKRSKKRKYPLRVNNNKSLGKLRKDIVMLFFTTRIQSALETLYHYFIRDPLPVIKGRYFDRIIKNRHSKSKHRTFTNYKPA